MKKMSVQVIALIAVLALLLGIGSVGIASAEIEGDYEYTFRLDGT